MECPYPDCKFVAAPGQAAEDGVCPGCDRPYKSQPTPSVSDMAMRNMPAPGEEDMGGNPLQEGILGDYQNRGVRDEAFASVKKSNEPLFPPCKNCGQVAGFEVYPFANGYLQCKNCQHLETPADLAGQFNTQSLDVMALPETEHPLGEHTGADESGLDPLPEWSDNRAENMEDYPPVPESSEVSNEGYQHIFCPACGSENTGNKMNFVDGAQRFKCHDCGYERVNTLKGGKGDPLEFKFNEMPTVDHPLGPSTGSMIRALAAEGESFPELERCPNCDQPIKGARLCPHCQHPLEHNASKQDIDPDIEIPAEVVDVLPPDPESIRPDKKRMDKKADFLNTLEDVAAPAVGGTAGFLVGGPAGAAVGAGLAGGAMDAAQGEGAGKAIGTGLTDAAIGGGLGLGAGALSEAAATGSTRGGIGSLMNSALNSGSANKLKNYYIMHQALKGGTNAVNNAYQSEMTPPAAMGQPQPTQAPSYFSNTAAKNDTPSSHDEVPSNDTDDPEEVDFKERNQGDTESKGLNLGEGINDIGGTDLGPDDFFSPDSEALKSLSELLPKVIDFAVGDHSGQDDPDLLDLHNKLEAEMPGYLDHANDDHGVKLISLVIGGTPDGSEDGDDPLLQDNDEAHDPLGSSVSDLIQAHVESALAPGLEGTCLLCGSVTDPSSGNCPQCGAGNTHHQPQPTNPDFETPQQMMSPPMQTTAGELQGQGPNSDEQKAAVAQLLEEQGRSEEIPNMIMNPQEYADELAEITGQEEPPEDIGQPGPPPPVEPTEQQGNMPMPGMSAPPPGQAMAAAIAKYAANVDVVAERCPKCKSHSTGYTDVESGKVGCKSCGHMWSSKPLVQNKEAADHDGEANPLGVPLADAEGPRDMEKEDDSSHTWIDSEGQPLHVGQSYEMYSENYEIPDRVKITAVKPDVVEYELIGEYGLGHETDLTHEEASIENISFVPSDQPAIAEGEPTGEGDLNQNMDDVPRPGAGEETDASTPHEFMSAFWNRKKPVDTESLVAAFDKLYGRDEWVKFLKALKQQEIEKGEWQPIVPEPGLTDGIAGGPQAVPQEQRVASPESINLEPNWDGMRAWLLNMARTDLANAVNVNDSMGSEGLSPEELAQAAGVSVEEVIGLGGGALDDLRELPETEHPQLGHEGKTADFDDINGPVGPNVDPCPECWGDGIDVDGNSCRSCGGTGYAGGGSFQPWNREDPLEQQFNAPAVEHRLGPHTGTGIGRPTGPGGVPLPPNIVVSNCPNCKAEYPPGYTGDQPCPNCGYSEHAAWDTGLPPDLREANVETGPEWLMEGVPRTAGAHMTPWEQREYVEEDGVARNADKLSLGGTHYEHDDLADSFLFGL